MESRQQEKTQRNRQLGSKGVYAKCYSPSPVSSVGVKVAADVAAGVRRCTRTSISRVRVFGPPVLTAEKTRGGMKRV